MAANNKTIDDFCRLCAIESQTGVTIYSAEGENLCLEEKIISCLRIEVSRDDMLPKRVCQSCNLLLEDYYRFSERASQVQQTLYFLLGLRLSHTQEQDTELCLMEGGVKEESNMIKKEFDDLIIQQGNVQIEGEKFDLLVSRDDIVPKEQKQYYAVRCERELENNKELEISGEFSMSKDYIDGNGEIKQSHRRKMLIPKKMVQEKNINEESCMKESECPEIENRNIPKNLDYSKENEEEIELSSEEDEESKKIELEWNKQWGIVCDQCQNVLADRPQFEKHYKSHNKSPSIYTCSYCKKSLDKYSSYKFHIFQHIHNGRFKCRFCNKKYFTKEMLQIHLETFHNQLKIFICEECGTTFTSQPRLDFHLKRHKKLSKEELRCTECGKTLQTRSGLAAHKSVHKLGRHFMCHICGKTFTQKINMQQHVKHHKGEKPYSCDICQKSFAEKSHLNRHKSFHTKDRPFQCPVCKKMYKTERCLKVHSQIHWNPRPYICSVCRKGFLSSTKLRQHYNCHTGERPYACKYCERTFTNYPNWLKHTRRRHKVDHKTGLSLKEESQSRNVVSVDTVSESIEIPESVIEFIEMPEVQVKEDGRDSVRSQHSILNMINTRMLEGSQFQIDQDAECQYHMNLMPSDLISSQVVYSDQVMVQQELLLQ